MRQRKSPSLHLRFGSFAPIDQIEIAANRQGMKIGAWAKAALLRQAKKESWQEFSQKAVMFHVFECLFLLHELSSLEAQNRARQQAESYRKELKEHASRKFD